MSSTEWETFCDESYYHMWRVRRKNERKFEDGFHLNNREDAEALVEHLNGTDQELAAVTAQRDRLVLALNALLEGLDPYARVKARNLMTELQDQDTGNPGFRDSEDEPEVCIICGGLEPCSHDFDAMNRQLESRFRDSGEGETQQV